LFFKIGGYFADAYPAYFTIPCSFLLRAISIYVFISVENPLSILAYASTVIMVMASFLENTTIDGMFAKNLPKEIRGSLNGVYAFFGNLGVMIFAKVGGYLYDHYGPNYPFMFVGVCDIVFFTFIVLLRLCNKFNQ